MERALEVRLLSTGKIGLSVRLILLLALAVTWMGCSSDRITDLFAESAAFTGRFKSFERGDYVWVKFEGDRGLRETFLLDDPTLACFFQAHDGELMKVSYLKTERYFEAGGGYYPANIITEVETNDTTFSDWADRTSPDWRKCL